MYQRNSNRNRNRRQISNDISFRDPVTMNRPHPFPLTDINSQYNRLQQLVRQQSPSSTTSSTASSSGSTSASPPANISSYATSMPPGHIQLLLSQSQLNAVQNAHHQQLLAAAALASQQQSHHSRHRHRNRLSSHQQQLLLKEKEKLRKSNILNSNNFQLSMMDFDKMRIKNKSTNTINWGEYCSRMESVEIDNNDTNKLIVDYLLCEGNYDIAMEFCNEINMNIENEFEINKCKMRSNIRENINNGNILVAIDLLKKYDKHFFDKDKHFNILLELQKQHLIELIICNKINEAFKYNLKYLLPQTKLNNINGDKNNKKEIEKRKKLLIEIGNIMTLIACQNIKNIPLKQKNLLSLNRREILSNKINGILLKNENKKSESLLFENMCKINYYQNFLMNLGIFEHFNKNKINLFKSKIMSYNEENIKKVKERHPEFGKNNKHKTNNDSINGITNWVKLDDKYKLKIKNYLPFVVDTSKCKQFKVKKLKKYNVIHVCDK